MTFSLFLRSKITPCETQPYLGTAFSQCFWGVDSILTQMCRIRLGFGDSADLFLCL
ncbi:hypothetical protein HMPREF9374_3367 [Desmospora sp. 8437]|nr:hypothetical protein HMPREF9374_3367 [Desmospora sp. 8437]